DAIDIVGREMRFDAVKVDVDASGLHFIPTGCDVNAGAPWQKLRIVLDLIDEIEHFKSRERNQHRLLHALHSASAGGLLQLPRMGDGRIGGADAFVGAARASAPSATTATG